MKDIEAVSVRLDGRASIEHQIDIHVVDLVEAIDNADITVLDILQGLKYVSDYRISNSKMPNLDIELMKKLAKGLLEQTHKKKGNLLNQKPTPEADLAFSLICDFIANVSEFRKVISTYSALDLKHRLKIHRRIQPRSTDEQKEMAATMLGLLTLRFPQFKDWKELVEEDEHDDVIKLIAAYADKFKTPTIAIADTIYPPPSLYFDKNPNSLLEMYQSDPEKGLSEMQVNLYRKNYGENLLPSPKKTSVWKMIWTQLTDFMVIILCIASIVELVLQEYKDASVLLSVVVINVAIGATQEYKANKALEALLTLTVAKASVIRDGKQMIIDAGELVPGDIVVLEEGEAVPADLRLLEVAQLDIIESILTGESLPVTKSVRTIRERTRKLPLGDCKGNAFMTTVVSRGRGKGVVVRTGENTEMGKISAAISNATVMKTNIEIKLAQLGLWLVVIAILLVVIIVLIGIAWKKDALDMVLVGISLSVSVIPEGLVAVVTISMALGVQRMAKLHAIVRKLPSVETVGSVTVICSDKTGTLTEGKMGAQRIWTSDNALYQITNSTSLDPLLGEIMKISSTSLDDAISANQLSLTHKPKEVSKSIEAIPGNLAATLMVASLCNNSGVTKSPEGVWTSIGDPTEVAMLLAGYKGGLGREWFMDSMGLVKLGEYAFDSDRKMMSSIYKAGEKTPKEISQDRSYVLCKGAPEAIMKHCTHYIKSSDTMGYSFLDSCEKEPLNDGFVELLSNQSADMAKSGLRVLALAIRTVTVEEGRKIANGQNSKLAESSLSFVGLIGLLDPPK
jgi:Ca2+-transporting ATPase